MSRKNNLDKFQEVMFADKVDLSHLTAVEQQQVFRYRFAFTQCLENPSILDSDLRDDLMIEFKISQSQAYRDIANIKIILPNIKAAGKEWIRYIVTEELKMAIKECKDAGIDLMKERILAIDKLGKYNKLDQDEGEEFPWDDIIPIPIDPTNDISVLGVVPMENPDEEIAKLYEKYKGDIDIEDIDYQDLTDFDDGRDKENILQ